MDGLTEQQAILRQTLGAWAGARYPFAARGAAGEALGDAWHFLVREMGLLDTAGIGAAEELVAMECAGRALLVEPLGEAFVAAQLLRGAGGARAQQLLADLAGGACVALAWSEAGMRDDFADIALSALHDGVDWVLNGAKAMVVGAPWCAAVLVAARTGAGLSLFAVPLDAPGLTVHSYPTIDDRRAADLVFANVRVPADALIGGDGAALPLLEAARDHALALQAGEAAGLLEEMLRQTVSYTGQRQQFGQAIAAFQALQHAMVEIYLEVELVKAASWLAVLSLGGEPAERALSCSAAQVTVARACRMIGQKAIQLHGGMGMTDELALGHYVRRALVIESAWGDADWHLARMAGI